VDKSFFSDPRITGIEYRTPGKSLAVDIEQGLSRVEERQEGQEDDAKRDYYHADVLEHLAPPIAADHDCQQDHVADEHYPPGHVDENPIPAFHGLHSLQSLKLNR